MRSHTGVGPVKGFTEQLAWGCAEKKQQETKGNRGCSHEQAQDAPGGLDGALSFAAATAARARLSTPAISSWYARDYVQSWSW